MIDSVYKPPAKPDANYIDLGTKVFPCTLDEFVETFLSKTAPMNQAQFYKTLPGYRDIKFEDSKDLNNTQLIKFQLSLTIPITGVPFLSKSRLVKDVTIDRSK